MSSLDPAVFDARATDSTRARLAGLAPADLALPVTPEWDVRGVLSHLVGGNLRFAAALRGESPDWPSRDAEPVDSLLTQLDSSAAVMAEAVAAITDPRAPVVMAVGTPPASFAVRVHAADMLVHGWDLAVATGQDPTLEPDLCEAAIAVLARYPEDFWGPGRYFAVPVETDASDPMSVLLARSGRDPLSVRAEACRA